MLESMQTEIPSSRSDNEIDLRQVVASVWNGRWYVVASTLLSSAIAVGVALQATPVFRAEALVQIREESKGGGGLRALAAQFGGLADFAGLGGGASGDRALALATLKSRVVVQGFIRDNNLLPVLFKNKWDPEGKRWKADDPKNQPTLADGYKAFSEGILKVSEDKKTGLVTVAIEWRDPEAAATWVSELIAHTNAYLRDKAILESEKNLEYLKQQAKETGLVELQQAVYALEDSELKKLMLAKGGGEYAIKTIDPAQTPEMRIRPKRTQIAIIGFLLGVFVGIGATITKDAFFPRTKT